MCNFVLVKFAGTAVSCLHQVLACLFIFASDTIFICNCFIKPNNSQLSEVSAAVAAAAATYIPDFSVNLIPN